MEVHPKDNESAEEEVFKSANMVQRVQKKILSKVVTRGVAKHFVSEATTRLFDNLYKIVKYYYNKSVAEKVMKNVIKLVVKMGVMMRGDKYSDAQNAQLDEVQSQMHSLCLTVLTFSKVAYSYDRAHMMSVLHETHNKLEPIVTVWLTEKSKKRLDMVFEHFQKVELLDGLFRIGGEHATELAQIVVDLESLVESDDI